MTLLAMRGVALARGGRTLFAGFDLTLAPGAAAIVAGPNGIGKSSLLRLAAGLLRAATGTVEAAPAALLDERTALDPELPLAEALRFWATVDGAGARVADVLPLLDLVPLAGVPVRLLSTGQRKRAGLARIALSPAPLWLLDEPANGLDAAAVTRLEAVVARHRAAGGAVLVATHLPLDLPDASPVRLEEAA